MFEQGTRLKMHYEGMLEDGTVFYSTRLQGNMPFEFVVGQGEVLPALEEHIQTMQVGDRATFYIPAERAYGIYDATLKETLPISRIPHALDLPIGGYVVFSTGQGPLRVKVESIENGLVTFDYNHEFAGQNLTFTVDLLASMRENKHLEHEKYYAQHHGGCTCHSLLDTADETEMHDCECGCMHH